MATSTDILVVDDTPANLRLLSGVLQSKGYHIRAAETGEKALQQVEEALPDLILLDIMMPGMDGIEVCEKLKADENTRDIPIIFLSALGDTKDIVRAFEAGGVDYVVKPFQFQEVLARVKSQITLVQQRKEIDSYHQQERRYFESLAGMKDKFTRITMHDMRNPLNVILNYAVVLENLNVAAIDEQASQALTGIRLSVNKMKMLVSDMLDLARMETGAGLSLEPILANDFLEGCLKPFYSEAGEKNISFSFVPLDEDLPLEIDVHGMEQAVSHLLSNAMQFTPENGSIELRAKAEDNHLTIEVQDTGLGIPKADIPHVWTSFFRVDSEAHHQADGSGLGLSIVKTIVEKHGGDTHVQSEPEKGSTFSIFLPLKKITVE